MLYMIDDDIRVVKATGAYNTIRGYTEQHYTMGDAVEVGSPLDLLILAEDTIQELVELCREQQKIISGGDHGTHA